MPPSLDPLPLPVFSYIVSSISSPHVLWASCRQGCFLFFRAPLAGPPAAPIRTMPAGSSLAVALVNMSCYCVWGSQEANGSQSREQSRPGYPLCSALSSHTLFCFFIPKCLLSPKPLFLPYWSGREKRRFHTEASNKLPGNPRQAWSTEKYFLNRAKTSSTQASGFYYKIW